MPRNEYDALRALLVECVQNFQPTAIRQHEIEDQHVRKMQADQFTGTRNGIGRRDGMPVNAQKLTQSRSQRGLVVNDRYS